MSYPASLVLQFCLALAVILTVAVLIWASFMFVTWTWVPVEGSFLRGAGLLSLFFALFTADDTRSDVSQCYRDGHND